MLSCLCTGTGIWLLNLGSPGLWCLSLVPLFPALALPDFSFSLESYFPYALLFDIHHLFNLCNVFCISHCVLSFSLQHFQHLLYFLSSLLHTTCLHNFLIPDNLHGQEAGVSLVSGQAAPAIGYPVTFEIYYCLCISSRTYIWAIFQWITWNFWSSFYLALKE